MKKKPYTASKLVCDLASNAGVFFLIFGILHLAVRQHNTPGYWGWIFIALAVVLIGLVILINVSIMARVKREKESATRNVDAKAGGIRIHADLILGLLLITYFSPLIGADAGVPVWLAFVSGILLAAGRILRCVVKWATSGIRDKAEKWKQRAEEIKKAHESEEETKSEVKQD